MHNISKFRSDVYFQTDDNYCTNYLQCSKYVLNIKWALMYVFFRKYAVVSFHLMFQISFLLQLHVGRRLIRLFHVILFLRISYFWNGRSISIDQTKKSLNLLERDQFEMMLSIKYFNIKTYFLVYEILYYVTIVHTEFGVNT